MTLLSVSDLTTTYTSGRSAVHAVDGVSLEIARGETIGLVGESGCGKSTLGKTILRLVEPSGGRILFDGEDLTALPERALRSRRKRLQMVFQDPFASLNPRQTIGEILSAPLAVHGVKSRAERQRRVDDILARVGLPPDSARRYPHEFSGGQRQRISVARAVVLEPSFVVLDEPTSALDMLFQAQMVALLQLHLGLSKRAALDRAADLLAEVAVRDPARVLQLYPHELSGGMRQRVLIAMAFACDPALVIADEPTTALDVTVQRQVLQLVERMRQRHGAAILFVTHDLGVVAKICRSMTVLHAGRVLEDGPTADVLVKPHHAYTRALLAATPRADRP
ncbi:MAG: ATP-binding cassette domain-containing protein, partial [Bradyrhizobium sp.]|nr:ATP-binding cassette domain-containing protein [Bradyrhizobium sp.]